MKTIFLLFCILYFVIGAKTFIEKEASIFYRVFPFLVCLIFIGMSIIMIIENIKN